MIVLGLTGGIASGKSTVLKMFAREGAATYDADKAVHRLLASDGETAAAIHRVFPGIGDHPPVDRALLGKIVFGDEAAMHTLESILHPRVRVMETLFLRNCRLAGKKLAVCDIPLLFETSAEDRYDAVIAVVCPASMQKQRALARRGMTLERYQQVTQRQMSSYEKLKRADFAVHTGLGLAYSYREVVEILNAMGVK